MNKRQIKKLRNRRYHYHYKDFKKEKMNWDTKEDQSIINYINYLATRKLIKAIINQSSYKYKANALNIKDEFYFRRNINNDSKRPYMPTFKYEGTLKRGEFING